MAVSFDVKNVTVVKEDDVRTLGVTEVEDRLKTTSQNLHELWQEFDATDGKIDNDHVEAIRRLNDNMTVLKTRADEVYEFKKLREEHDREFERQIKPAKKGGMFPRGTTEPTGDGKHGERRSRKSVTAQFIESRAFKEFDPASKRSPSVELEADLGFFRQKALVSTDNLPIEPQRLDMILGIGEQQPTIADLLPQGFTESNAITYIEEVLATNAAAFIAQGAQKPESAFDFEERSAVMRKVATVLPVTEELFQDAPAMRAYLEARLRSFIAIAEDAALLNGTGVAPQLQGILNTPGILTQAKGTDPTPDAIYRAMTKIQTTGFLMPSGVVLHPNDWMDIRLLKTADGTYIWGSPADVAALERIWGLPVVKTMAIAENTGLVGAFDTAAQIFRKDGVQFAVSDQHADFFITNKLMLRVEMRELLAVYRPSGFATVTGI